MEYLTKSTLKKERGGWQAETHVNHLGRDWKVTTWKSSRGIKCYAQAGTLDTSSPGFTSFNYVLMSSDDPSITLATDNCRATEKSIRQLHTIGLESFSRMSDLKEALGS